MAWYNYKINKENAFIFQSKENGYVKSILDCWKETRDEGPIKNDSHDKLKKSMEAGFKFFEKLKEELKNEYNVDILITKSQLQDLGVKRDHYRSGYYINIDKIDNSVLNISHQLNDAFIEVRHSTFFLKEFTSQELESYREYIGWITGNARIKTIHFDDNPDFYKKLIQYIVSLNKYVSNGGRLRKGGESLIESILISDIKSIFQDNKNFTSFRLAHGERPIKLKNENWAEIDIRVNFTYDTKKIDLAIEIQGPEHYGLGRNNNPELRFDIDYQKINWCLNNNVLFFWFDWDSLNEFYLMDSSSTQKLRLESDRKNKINILINYIIECYNNEFRFLYLIDTNKENTINNDKKRNIFQNKYANEAFAVEPEIYSNIYNT